MLAEESTGDEVEDKRLNRRTNAMLTALDKQVNVAASSASPLPADTLPSVGTVTAAGLSDIAGVISLVPND